MKGMRVVFFVSIGIALALLALSEFGTAQTSTACPQHPPISILITSRYPTTTLSSPYHAGDITTSNWQITPWYWVKDNVDVMTIKSRTIDTVTGATVNDPDFFAGMSDIKAQSLCNTDGYCSLTDSWKQDQFTCGVNQNHVRRREQWFEINGVTSNLDVFYFQCSNYAPNNPPSIAGLPDQTVMVGQTIPFLDLYQYASDAQDPDTSLAFAIDSQSNTGAISCYISGNRYLGCNSATQSGSGYSDIAVRVTDTGGLYSTDALRITVQGQIYNTPPVISGLPDYTLSAGQTISLLDLHPYASDTQDPDTALAFSISSQSNQNVINCYITGNRYLGCNSASQTGYSDITVMVADTGGLYSTDTLRITVSSQPNNQPVISGLPDNSLSIGQAIGTLDLYSYAYDSQDPDSSLSFSIDSQGNQNVISCFITGNRYLGCNIAQNSGYSDITVRVTDTGGLYSTDSFRITVAGQTSNTPPVISGLPDYTIGISATIPLLDLYSYASDTQDPDTSLTFSIDSQSNPNLISCYISGNRYLGCNTANDQGTSTIVVRVTDTGGLINMDSFTIDTLGNSGDHAPSIASININPSDPTESDELTCEVHATDSDADLDRVQFRWYVEGGLDRTRTTYASGSSAWVSDNLASSRFNNNDEVRCEAIVYDDRGSHDTDSDTVTIGNGNQGCGVDVYSLEVVGSNRIRFRIKNTADQNEDISYKIYVDNYIIEEDTININSNDWESVQYDYYNFGTGDYAIKVRATSDCGAVDTEILSNDVHGTCTAQYTDEYRCSGNWQQRVYRYNDCSTSWVNYEYCSQGCSSDVCGYNQPSQGQCGVSIQRFDYQSSVTAGSGASVWTEARNTGSGTESIETSIWLDGQLVQRYPTNVAAGYTSLRQFYYYPGAGTHTLMVKAQTTCGSVDTKTATITATPSSIQPPYVPPAPTPTPALPTTVSIYPSSLDTSSCESKFVTIDMHNSQQQAFTITATGMPSDWMSYQSQSIVDSGDRQLYIYVSPKELGQRTMHVTVKAEGEGKTYSQDVSVFTTATCSTVQPSEGITITGQFLEISQNPVFWVILIVILAIVVAIVAGVTLQPDEEYYEPVPPQPPTKLRERNV